MKLGKFWLSVALGAALTVAYSTPGHSAKKYKEVEVTNGGGIGGKVTFEGALPDGAIEQILITKNPDVCGTGEREVVWVDVKDGALRRALVFIAKIKEGKAQVALFSAGILNLLFLDAYHSYFTNTVYKVASSIPQVATTLIIIAASMFIDRFMYRGATDVGPLHWCAARSARSATARWWSDSTARRGPSARSRPRSTSAAGSARRCTRSPPTTPTSTTSPSTRSPAC